MAMDEKALKKIHLLPNVITAFGLACGLFIIFKMSMLGVGQVDEKTLYFAAAILLVASAADVLDGAVARALKAESRFGGIFDSLADAITFGVSPAVVVLKTLSIAPGSELSFWVTTAVMVFSICGVLRLVRFSTAAQTVTKEETTAASKNFTGLPIPAAAATIFSTNLFLFSEEGRSFLTYTKELHAVIMVAVLLLIGYLMISRWKFPSQKNLDIRVASFRRVFLFVLAAVITFYGFIYHFPVVFMAVSWLYIIVAFTLSGYRLIAGRRSKTLEEFEPAEDDLDLQ
jgi:CDP-diacylglycerol--serine O-phosphatidyltransferase